MPLKLGTNAQRSSVRDLPSNPGLPGLALGNNAVRTVRGLAGPWMFGGFANYASLTTALAGTNNDLVWTANTGGTAGNSIRIAYVVSGTSTPLSVSVSGTDITVNVATSAGGAATSTAAQIAAAVAASGPAGRLVTGANAAGNDGTGVVAAMGLTNLTGGTDYVVGRA
jgi:hypothetical protein